MMLAIASATGGKIGVAIRSEDRTQQREAEEYEQQDGTTTAQTIIVPHPERWRYARMRSVFIWRH